MKSSSSVRMYVRAGEQHHANLALKRQSELTMNVMDV